MRDSTSVTYDIALTDSDGKAIQPTDDITVLIPEPEALKGRDLKVFRSVRLQIPLIRRWNTLL